MERGRTQGIQFIVMIVLARLLLSEEFGLIVLVTIFITTAGVFVHGGYTTALIQKKNVDEVDYSSIFYLNLFVASILYIYYAYFPVLFDGFHLTRDEMCEKLKNNNSCTLNIFIP